jgi:hypothetical protein
VVGPTFAAMSGDFDFYVGTWEVANRRLTARLADSRDWEEFPALSVARPIFGGAGNLDEITFPTRRRVLRRRTSWHGGAPGLDGALAGVAEA